MMTTGLIRSPRACRRTVSVWTQTPSTQSTTTRAPSVTRRAAVTSEEKSTWPGESIKLIKNLRLAMLNKTVLISISYLKDIFDFIVTQLSVKRYGGGFDGDTTILIINKCLE